MEDGLILTAHHIIPRPKGKTKMSNLITLCNSCHDFIELNGFDFSLIKNDIKIIAKDKNWHKWVYGGYARPNK